MTNYSSQNIKVLKGLEAVRVRPGMYIGNTDDGSGLHHMVYEVTDNSVDEALAGYCKKIHIIMHNDGSVSVEDDGRGIPVDIHESEGVSAAQVIMTQLHAGGKFDQDTYKISGGLHGVGVSVVNALSIWLEMLIIRNGKYYFMRFRQGDPEAPLKEISLSDYKTEGSVYPSLYETFKNKKSGTYIRFMPDSSIFSSCEFHFKTLVERYKELAYLNPGLYFSIYEEKTEKKEEFFDMGGVSNFVLLNAKNKTLLFDKPFICKFSKDNIEVDIAFTWSSNSYDDNTLCFTNNIPQKEGGTHLQGFRSGLTKAIQNFIPENKLKGNMTCTGEDIREGLFAVLSAKVPNPRFASQTKEKLVSTEVRAVVDQAMNETMSRILEENPNYTKILIDRILESIKAREAAKKARELVRTNKSVDYSFSVAGKLADCAQKKPELRELFVVEGQSAGGSAKMARNRDNQAVLALQGKILNVEKSVLSKILQYDAIRTLIAVLNTGVELDCKIEECKYHKIIIMTDADVDGSHIRTLILTFLFRYMKPLLEAGYVYASRPPLYAIKSKKHNTIYLKNEKELEDYLINNTAKALHINRDDTALSDHEKEVMYKMCLKVKSAFAQFKELSSDFLESKAYLNTFDENNMTLFAQFLANKYESAKVVFMMDDLWQIEVTQYAKTAVYALRLNDISDEIKNFVQSWQPVELKINGKMMMLNSVLDFIKQVENLQSNLFEISRFKGLGEMNPKELRETGMLPESRIIEQISIDDLEQTDYMTKLLMGEDVPMRRKFIEENALFANLDT